MVRGELLRREAGEGGGGGLEERGGGESLQVSETIVVYEGVV